MSGTEHDGVNGGSASVEDQQPPESAALLSPACQDGDKRDGGQQSNGDAEAPQQQPSSPQRAQWLWLSAASLLSLLLGAALMALAAGARAQPQQALSSSSTDTASLPLWRWPAEAGGAAAGGAAPPRAEPASSFPPLSPSAAAAPSSAFSQLPLDTVSRLVLLGSCGASAVQPELGLTAPFTTHVCLSRSPAPLPPSFAPLPPSPAVASVSAPELEYGVDIVHWLPGDGAAAADCPFSLVRARLRAVGQRQPAAVGPGRG